MSADHTGERPSHIDHVNIVVTDLEPATDFFTDLGFEVRAGGTLEGDWVDAVVGLEGVDAEFIALGLPLGQTAIELLKFNNPKGDADPDVGKANQIGFRHAAFAVKGIEDWYRRLQEKGVECLSEVQSVPNYRGKQMFYFRGPEGILLEMAEYPE